jgi:hypothetical protein
VGGCAGEAATVQQLEDVILTKARDLRQAPFSSNSTDRRLRCLTRPGRRRQGDNDE